MVERLSANREREGTDPGGNAGIDTAESGSFKFSSSEAFDEVLAIHRKRAPAVEVHFLKHLCFPLDETADPAGLRFVLWQPVALFLHYGFEVVIEEQMCRGQVALVYLGHDAAAFTKKIIPPIEAVRRKNPLWIVSSGPEVLLKVLMDVSDRLRWHDQAIAEKVDRMRMEFKRAVRRGDYSGLSALRGQLSELAAESADSDVRACVEFLRKAGEDAHSWPPHSAALASERVLARDWLTPEEDAAWSHL